MFKRFVVFAKSLNPHKSSRPFPEFSAMVPLRLVAFDFPTTPSIMWKKPAWQQPRAGKRDENHRDWRTCFRQLSGKRCWLDSVEKQRGRETLAVWPGRNEAGATQYMILVLPDQGTTGQRFLSKHRTIAVLLPCLYVKEERTHDSHGVQRTNVPKGKPKNENITYGASIKNSRLGPCDVWKS